MVVVLYVSNVCVYRCVVVERERCCEESGKIEKKMQRGDAAHLLLFEAGGAQKKSDDSDMNMRLSLSFTESERGR
jgi:hypothetical protein